MAQWSETKALLSLCCLHFFKELLSSTVKLGGFPCCCVVAKQRVKRTSSLSFGGFLCFATTFGQSRQRVCRVVVMWNGRRPERAALSPRSSVFCLHPHRREPMYGSGNRSRNSSWRCGTVDFQQLVGAQTGVAGVLRQVLVYPDYWSCRTSRCGFATP
eukprot:TRINITY_DN2414_c0_g1_i1.p1 TRINITY_DN2414_c0_g1~~TRINITY_DN2414_c0_g1_i1.p1  ORF type:complete len:158 (+),score=0.82 TRINITY_DN2414_c0_g1_i1:3-476(+)